MGTGVFGVTPQHPASFPALPTRTLQLDVRKGARNMHRSPKPRPCREEGAPTALLNLARAAGAGERDTFALGGADRAGPKRELNAAPTPGQRCRSSVSPTAESP